MTRATATRKRSLMRLLLITWSERDFSQRQTHSVLTNVGRQDRLQRAVTTAADPRRTTYSERVLGRTGMVRSLGSGLSPSFLGVAIRLFEEVWYETRLIANHQGPILPDAHPATGIVNHPCPDIGVVAVEASRTSESLITIAAVGIRAGRFDEGLAVFSNSNVGSLAPEQRLADNGATAERLGFAIGRQQIFVLGKHLPENRQQSLVRQ